MSRRDLLGEALVEEREVSFEANRFRVGQVVGNDVLPVRIGQDARGRQVHAVVHRAACS